MLNAADGITLTVMKVRPIIPYPTGRSFPGHAFPGTACQATIGVSLRDVLATISQQPLAKNLGVEDEHDEEPLDQE